MFIVSANPLALGLLTPPGKFQSDIVVGDAQPFGIPSAYGEPHCGFFAVTKKLMRKVPVPSRRTNGRRKRKKRLCAYPASQGAAYPPG
nr:hypothetical protein P5665_14555 [Bacillus subtilis]WGE06612.1 hypothetical protein P5658_14090 [Bacillus subtilis]